MRTLASTQKILLFIAVMIGVISVGIADYNTGAELAFSIFYLFPVGIAAWYIGWKAGFFISIESTFSWYLADILARDVPYTHSFYPAWNAGVRLITFLTIAILFNFIRTILKRETLHARIDYLTGAENARAFYEMVEKQISLFSRKNRPFSILYIDMDNLKQLNDTHGHSAGDKALQDTVSTLQRTLRPSDIISRLGGDEFAVLLMEADARAAEFVSTRVQTALRKKPGRRYGVTYSIGALSCLAAPASADELMEQADDLMYEAKRGGKDTIRLGSYGASGQEQK
jgi:diguanylate cyclase (GGDEF)-like protein